MFDLKKIFPPKQNTVRVRVERDTIATLANGTRSSVSEGDTIEITESEFSKFDPEDLTVIDPKSQTAAGSRFANPAPPREDPAPMPEAWKGLPACFAQWWALSERFRVAKIHEGQIRSARKNLFGSDINLGDFSDAGTALGISISGGKGENLKSIVRNIDPRDPETAYQNRRFESAIANAIDHLADLRRSKTIELQRLFIACSDERLANAEELQRVNEGLAQTAFAIFHARVAALGLAEGHVRRLFSGSADALKYLGDNTAPSTTGQTSLGLEEDGQPRVIFDDSVGTTAEILLSEKARLERLKPLLATAKAELAKTSKLAG